MSEWCSSGADMKKPRMGSTCVRPIRGTYLASEGVEYNTQQKTRRWVVLDVRPIVGDFC